MNSTRRCLALGVVVLMVSALAAASPPARRNGREGALSSSTWDLVGNTLTGGEILGSTNSQPLAFWTNNQEAGRFDATGRLGLGTTTPVEKLHVHNGAVRITG